MVSQRFFGFGSLMSTSSLLRTAPNAQNIRPCYIVGFTRDFSKWDADGWASENPAINRVPYCAVDIVPATDQTLRVNGVVFEVSPEDADNLRKREVGYNVISTAVYDFESNELIGDCFVFSAGTQDGSYEFNSITQESYLQECIEGARQHGELFLSEFMNTTYIDGKPLSAISHLPSAQPDNSQDALELLPA